MPRKSTKSAPTNVNEGFDMIMATRPQKTVDEAAESLGVAAIRLLELFSDALSLPEAMIWEVIPQEHEHLLNEFKAQAANVQALPEEVIEATPEPEIASPEPPILEDEPQPKKRGGRAKKESTALTKRKSTVLKESEQKSQQLASSEQQVKVSLHARKGQQSGAQLATIELAAEDVTYRQIKGQALARKVGQLTSEIASESGFDPIQVLAELGIDSNSEIFEDLRQQIEPALGKLESATAEIVETAWVNGINLETELTNLENLLTCNSFASDCWQ